MDAKKSIHRLEPHNHFKKFIIGMITTYEQEKHLVYDQDALIKKRIVEMKKELNTQEQDEDSLYMLARDEIDLIIKRDFEKKNGPFFMSKDDLSFFKEITK